MKNKTIVTDGVKTIFGSMFYMVALQFIVFPFFSKNFDAHYFGEILTIFSLIMLFSIIIGSTLNNIRLIYSDMFESKYVSKEFVRLFLFLNIIGGILLSLILYFYFEEKLIFIFNACITLFLFNFKNYVQVHFRLNLEFTKLLMLVLLQSVTMVAFVYGLKFNQHNWIELFLFNEIIGISYLLYELKYLKNSKKFDKKKYNVITKHYINLASINIVNNIIVYFDRFILLILVNSKAVTIAFLATFVGKIIASIISPINSVLLSYISKVEISHRKLLNNLVKLSFFIVIMTTLIIYPISYIIIKYIYHADFDEISKYIILANLGIIVSVVGNILFVFNMKFIPIKYQTRSQVTFFICYFVLTIPITYLFGTNGFFYSVLVSNIIRVISIYYYGRLYCEEYK